MIEKINYNKILVPIDGSVKSFDSFKYAMHLSKVFDDCKITLIHVINEEHINQMRSKGDSKYSNISEMMYNQGKKYLSRAFNEARTLGFNEHLLNKKILKGNVVEEIIQFAEDFDIIVMAARGKKHVVEYLMGHVASRVINLAKIPVLIVP
jgi:nucleotide-binding universal stress UspA family protein